VADFVVEDDDSNFLIGTLYNAPGGNDSLVNGAYSVILGNTGTVTLPAGGTISEGIVTSNPTIQLTPASPDVASQKLVIKGGGGQYYITENGIDLGTNNNVWEVTDSATFYVYAPTRPNETLYWWIVPEGSGISTTMSGIVELGSEGEGVFNFTVISDAYEFRVRVSPEEDNYDPESIGVESVLINGDAPAYGDYHLHLTTGDLSETSIFLGTDDHNVRTTTDGKIQITTFVNSYTVNNVWEFDTDGALTLPNGGHIGPSGGKGQGTTYGGANDHLVSLTSYYNSGLYSSCVTAYADGTLNITAYNDGGPNPAKIWTFDNTGTLTLPDDSDIKSSTNIDITIDTPDSSTFNWRFGADGGLQFPDATVQTTAYTGNTTVSRPSTTGIPAIFSLSTSNNPNFTPGSYPNLLVGFDGKNVTLDIVIDESYNISIENIRNASPATFVLGDSAVLNGEFFGGTSPADNLTIVVFELVPVAIDLTKSINKLTDGEYTLADGVEGQIMYLVRSPETISENVYVDVDNADGANPLSPFRTNLGFTNVDNTGICTLIFTDGSWKQTGGNWD
jgi:hypothetical protein